MRNHFNFQSGAALLELSISIPVILLLILGSIYLNDQIQQKQKLNSLIRIVAIGVVSDCYKMVTNEDPGVKSCIENSTNNAIATGLEIDNDFSILISKYSNGDDGIILNYTLSAAPKNSLAQNVTSHYTAEIIVADYGNIFTYSKTMILIEVFLKDKNLVIAFKDLLFKSSDFLYEAIAF